MITQTQAQAQTYRLGLGLGIYLFIYLSINLYLSTYIYLSTYLYLSTFHLPIYPSAGKAVVMWRAWETKEQNLARGVPPEQMGLAAKG